LEDWWIILFEQVVMIDVKKNLGGNSTSTDVGKDGSSFGHLERLSVLLLVVVLVSLRVADDAIRQNRRCE
jgi:hypothetical protein